MSIDTDVLDVVRKFLNGVRRSGPENVMAICPFHVKADGRPEATPSFAISLTTGLWMCHSCHEKGNLRTFLRDIGVPAKILDTFYKPLIEQVEERTAHQARKTGRIFPKLTDRVLEESTLGLFEYCPLGLIEQGFTEATLKHFDIGYDTKNNRITFPIRDILGRLVGISGRATVDGYSRYKVYAKDDYDAWGIPPVSTDKSQILWNAERVYPESWFDKSPAILVCEGFKACMWSWQAGFKNVVALMGSFLSPYQRAVLERMGGAVYLFLDNDPAGQKGVQFISRQLGKTLKVRIVHYEEHQPTDLSPQQVQEAVSKAVDYLGPIER